MLDISYPPRPLDEYLDWRIEERDEAGTLVYKMQCLRMNIYSEFVFEKNGDRLDFVKRIDYLFDSNDGDEYITRETTKEWTIPESILQNLEFEGYDTPLPEEETAKIVSD